MVVGHLEHESHVVRGALAAILPPQVSVRGRGDEVVVLAWPELHPAWGGGEGAEGDGEVEHVVWLVADGRNLGLPTHYAAGLVLLLAHIVDDILLRSCGGCRALIPGTAAVLGTDEVCLVKLVRQVACVDVDDVVSVVDAEDGVGSVPVDVVVPGAIYCVCQ